MHILPVFFVFLLVNIDKCFKCVIEITIDFTTTGGDNNMQMVQMSKTLSTKSIRDDLCTNPGTGRGTRVA